MTHHDIVLDVASKSRAYYGITHTGRNVYDTTTRGGPTRLAVWENIGRPNPYHGAQLGDRPCKGRGELDITITEYSLPKTLPRFLDPHNNPTDEPVSLLLSPESTVICSNTSMNTGQPGSGQVYAEGKLADGDTATLFFPLGDTREVVLHFPPHHNGHGYATFA